MSVGSLLLREADASDIEQLLSFRNDPLVNRFMIRTSVEPVTFRREWLAVSSSGTDFSCVGEVDGAVAAMGFLDVVDGMGQPGMPRAPRGSSDTSSARTPRAGALQAISPAAS